MNLDLLLQSEIQKAVTAVFNQTVENLQLQATNAEFEGTHTLVCFPLTKLSRKGPEETARMVGEYLVEHSAVISKYNVVKGFLNLSLHDSIWVEALHAISSDENYGQIPYNGQEIMIEYSSPNTNKPLHLGHLRNNFLGYSVSEIYKANGYKVHKVQIINDRGIHICKSMAAWKLFGNGETPQSSGIKGDHLVGKYYVIFDKELKKQLAAILKDIDNGNFELFQSKEVEEIQKFNKLISDLTLKLDTEISKLDIAYFSKLGADAQGLYEAAVKGEGKWKDISKCFEGEAYKNLEPKVIEQKQKELANVLKPILSLEQKIEENKSAIKDIAQNKTAIMRDAQELLRKWEQKDTETVELWKMMNSWVYEGFDATYKRMGVDFEKLYFESDTYLLGKELVMQGLEKGIFFKKEDGSVWVDLTSDGLDQKVLLRADGTSVYMTQDIGTAILRFTDFPKISGQVYTVGNEQEYHFKVLFLILNKLGYDWAKRCFHLSYGMVDLPTGKMKSREGTVVDADDLMQEMHDEAEKQTRELGKLEGVSEADAQALFEMIGLGALKFFLLKVDPKKRMLFDPNESIQLQGFTGPFIQYTHARIKAIVRKAESLGIQVNPQDLRAVTTLEPAERDALYLISSFENKIREAAKDYSPAIIANYAFELAKAYNQFYQSIPIFSEENTSKLKFRVTLSYTVARIIKRSMKLLGIEVPERM